MPAPLAGVLLGVALGAKHALEPDHVAAVSVLTVQSPGARRGAMLGAFWGVGHTIALLAVGLTLSAVSAAMPERLAAGLELGVAAMLVTLGIRAVLRAAHDGRVGPEASHRHGAKGHRHSGPPDHVHVGRWTLATRPLLVGMIHGLAGSGALTALVVAEQPTFEARLAFMALFGLGSIAGMVAVSGLAGWPLALLARRPRTARAVAVVAGLASALYGVVWGWPLWGEVF